MKKDLPPEIQKIISAGSAMKKDLSPDIQKLIDENPIAVMVGMALMGIVLMTPTKKKGTTVPELGGRRNAAWRGKGSFGKAPFGKQVGHRR